MLNKIKFLEILSKSKEPPIDFSSTSKSKEGPANFSFDLFPVFKKRTNNQELEKLEYDPYLKKYTRIKEPKKSYAFEHLQKFKENNRWISESLANLNRKFDWQFIFLLFLFGWIAVLIAFSIVLLIVIGIIMIWLLKMIYPLILMIFNVNPENEIKIQLYATIGGIILFFIFAFSYLR